MLRGKIVLGFVFALSSCCGDYNAVRYNDDGEVVTSITNAVDCRVEGGCIVFREGCVGEERAICGNVECVPR